ncbi:hypothetical protein AB6Q56_15000 [Dechloromonas sp. ARDL1]|uniref:hypothetical protein n=1 Tax=Dechloromonas sp. ARDL1 TaxID=3322121 RepID=UPI003DA78442
MLFITTLLLRCGGNRLLTKTALWAKSFVHCNIFLSINPRFVFLREILQRSAGFVAGLSFFFDAMPGIVFGGAWILQI